MNRKNWVGPAPGQGLRPPARGVVGDVRGARPRAWAGFREVVLLDDREASIERFDRRARDDDDPWIRHHRLVGLHGGPVLLGTMYDDLLEVVRLHPRAVVVPSVAGAVQATYGLLRNVLRGSVP